MREEKANVPGCAKMWSNSIVSLVSESLPMLGQIIEVNEYLPECDSRTTFINLLKFAFGTGLLALPFGMEAAGLFPSVCKVKG